MNPNKVLKLLHYQKLIIILECSIKSLSANYITTIDLKLKILEIKKKMKLLQSKINVIKTN